MHSDDGHAMVLISDGEWIAQPVDYRNAERRIGVGYYDYSYDYVVTIYATEMTIFLSEDFVFLDFVTSFPFSPSFLL